MVHGLSQGGPHAVCLLLAEVVGELAHRGRGSCGACGVYVANRFPLQHLAWQSSGEISMTRILKTFRSVTFVILVSFLAQIVPVKVLANDPVPPPTVVPAPAVPASAPEPAEKTEALLADMHSLLEQTDADLGKGKDTQDHLRRLKTARDQLNTAWGEERSALAEIGARLRASGQAAAILERHDAFALQAERMMSEVLASLDAVNSAPKSQLLDMVRDSKKRIAEAMPPQRHAPLDPQRMPHRRAQPTARKPRLQKAEYADLGNPVRLALNGALTSPLLAQSLADVPTPDDLAETPEVQLTPQIRTLAAALHGSPVEIFNFVHNTIEFIPTHGSVQGAQLTLDSKRGNAFDIASLLLALLRAADIPARYALGTVQIPVTQVQNWLGGLRTPAMVQQALGQGGIPNVGLVEGGELTHIRMEHVWVEAFVDYVPSRGAKAGPGDTWVSMDASFKQHTFMPASSVLTAVPFDIQTLSQQLLMAASVDPSLGRIAGLDERLIQAALEQHREQLGQYARDHGLDVAMESPVPKQSIVPNTGSVLAGSLPYEVVVKGGTLPSLPDELRHYATINGFASAFDRALGTPAFSYRIALASLNSKRLGLTFEPATQADADALASIRASNASSIPVYLIRLKPVVTLDGQAVSTGPAVGMGQRQFVDVVLQDTTGSETIAYEVVAGDEIVVGITGNGVTADAVRARFASVPPDNAPETLHQVALHYWMESDMLADATARDVGVFTQRLLSVGLFSSPLSVTYLFGVPRSGAYQSRFMDVKRSLVAAAGEDQSQVTAFLEGTGVQSSFLEGDVFDQLFGRGVSRGFSAVQLIADANASGIPIYQITSANAAAVLPLLAVDAAVKVDITNALNAGKTVLIPARNVSRGAWNGVGYIVRDPATGAGAYLISGGLNGGGLIECLKRLVPVFEIILAIALLLLLLAWLAPIIAAILAKLIPELVAAMIALFVLAETTAPAYAAGGGLRRSKQANPCCPEPPPAFCVYDTGHPHWPCTGDPYPMDHWHYYVYNQDWECRNFQSPKLSLNTPEMCGPPPVPCPPY
jgi:hypothetical protein